MAVPVIAAAALALALLAPAGGPGVGVGGATMCLAAPARPGHSYRLGDFYVTDTGTISETVTAGQEEPLTRAAGVRDTPQGWISVAFPKLLWVIPRHSAGLDPGGAVSLPVTLAVPPGARPGVYRSGVTATTVARPAGGGGVSASTGAGGSTAIVFAVAPARAPSCGDPYGPPPYPDPAPPVNPATQSPTASPAAAPTGAAPTGSPAAPGPRREVDWGGLAPFGLLALAAAGWWRRRRRGRR